MMSHGQRVLDSIDPRPAYPAAGRVVAAMIDDILVGDDTGLMTGVVGRLLDDLDAARGVAKGLAERVAAQSELLSRRAGAVRPWWEQAAEVEGGCPL